MATSVPVRYCYCCRSEASLGGVPLCRRPKSTKNEGDMTHAEQYSTSEPGVSREARTRSRSRVGALLALAVTTGITSLVVVPTRPASADQISDAKAQASALTAKIAAEQRQIAALTSQYDAASYKISQLNSQIAQSQAEVAKDQAEVAKDQGQLRNQAVADYMS